MAFKTRAVVAAVAFLVSGCAGYSAIPVNNNEQDAKSDGVRYYEVAPFLLVYSDGKGNLTSKIEARNRFLQYHAVRGQHWSKLHFPTVMFQKPYYALLI
jgi:hypothetical protein